jgi:chemotaxis protein CheX
MSLVETELREIMKNIWETQLGMDLTDSEVVLRPSEDDDGADLMTGSIQISGAWNGAVHVYCSRKLITRAAALMFAVEGNELSEEDVRDALGELANMTAGNVKALLAHDSYVSLPTVVEGSDYDLTVLESELLSEASFTFAEEWLTVAVFQSQPREE